MAELPDALFRRWGHSFEEDTADERVYRPAEYDFPLARGRAGLEFRADGTFVRYDIGPADAPRGVPGRWTALDQRTVRVDFDDGSPSRVYEIVGCDERVLRLRPRAG